tara:strand:- start:444 stop:719 length:276 start_codon:yes stop_codon:yes gene_type:complete
MIKEGVTPKEKAMEHIIAGAMVRIAELEAEFYPVDSRVSVVLGGPSVKHSIDGGEPLSTPNYDRKVVKQMKKLVNRMARDIGADDQYFDVV